MISNTYQKQKELTYSH